MHVGVRLFDRSLACLYFREFKYLMHESELFTVLQIFLDTFQSALYEHLFGIKIFILVKFV